MPTTLVTIFIELGHIMIFLKCRYEEEWLLRINGIFLCNKEIK